MKTTKQKSKRIIALDMHPDLYSAACLKGADPATATTEWIHDRLETSSLEKWAAKHLEKGDTLVLEASGNSFQIAARLHHLGYEALVLESCQASHIKHGFCDDDRQSSLKLARVYLTGLAKIVWQPTEQSRQHREIFFAHRNAVKDATRWRNRIKSHLNERCVRLPKGTRLTDPSGLAKALGRHPWSDLQKTLIQDAFEQLWTCERRRKRLERVMVEELSKRPQWAQLWRLMGIRHRIAFALMAIIGDVNRFPTAKKLAAYLGLSPRKKQSGNDAKGKQLGIGKGGRGDVRALLIQSAQNALNQRASPLHAWGWKLLVKKSRNQAIAAVARKIAVAVWHLLKGHFTPLVEAGDHLVAKLAKIATVLGKQTLKSMGFERRAYYIENQIQLIRQNT